MNTEVSTLYKDKLLDTLDAFDSLCTQHHLDYCACAGSALGAVRHQNIIPWDDDIDVFMPRKDYDIFLNLSFSLKNGKYRLAKMGDKHYIYSFAKFYDATTTVIEQDTFPNCVVGVWIDVFPLDEEFRSIDEVKKMKEKYMDLYRKYQFTFYSIKLRTLFCLLKKGDLHTLYNIISSYFASTKRKESIRKKFLSFDKEWRGEGGDQLLCHVGMYSIERERFPKKWMNDFVYLPFGKTKIRVMADYHNYLTNLYGDYMTPPPLEQQITHHFHYYLNLKEGLSLSQVKERISKGERLVF